MGCGGRRNPFDFLGGLGGCGGYRPYTYSVPDYREDYDSNQLLSEVKLMYAKGKIDADLYYTIKSEIAAGQFTWEDLRILKQEKVNHALKCPEPQAEGPQTGLFARELAQLAEAKKTITRLKEEIQSQIGVLQNKLSAVDKEIQTILPVNQDLAQKLLETKFDLQDKLSNYNAKLSRLEQEETDVNTLQEEIQLKRLDYQASNTNARIKELKLRLTSSDSDKT